MSMTSNRAARKISVNISVEVDAEAWAETYGNEGSDLRVAVKAYVLNAVTESPAAEAGAITSATLR